MTRQAIGIVVLTGDGQAVKAAVDAAASAAKTSGGVSVAAFPPQDFPEGIPESDIDEKQAATSELERMFHSPAAGSIKQEICSVGRKLWQRGYVDGNGGNISCRLAENAVICTPTMMSKGDIRPEDLCMVDLEGNQLAGSRTRTSEIFLHLEIYKQTPEAKAVVHCHPPFATAYAISGRTPPAGLLPEFDYFIGSVAIAEYQTPGTRELAETVRPFARDYNTILLGNHGVVCWADTPAHAEWRVENLETYCQTILITKQL